VQLVLPFMVNKDFQYQASGVQQFKIKKNAAQVCAL